MRPLTETIPKPLIPLIDRPFLAHVFDRLLEYGVDEVLLSSSYLGPKFAEFLGARTDRPRVTWITEATPLGTAGAIANAAHHLHETFLVLNGDILTDLELTALVDRHHASGAAATIALTHVADARPYGLVERDRDGRVVAFREKPADPIPGDVNAGTYVLEPDAIAGVPAGVAVSIERETFPSLIDRGAGVFAFVFDAYWMDLGTPDKYLRATADVLDGRVAGLRYPAPCVDPTADVAGSSTVGVEVVVGPGASVGERASVERSVALAGASIGADARVVDSILGPGAWVGNGATVDGSVLAERAGVAPRADASGARVAAGEVFEPTRVR